MTLNMAKSVTNACLVGQIPISCLMCGLNSVYADLSSQTAQGSNHSKVRLSCAWSFQKKN